MNCKAPCAEKAAEARKKEDAAKAAAAEREAKVQTDALLRRREAIASAHPPVARHWPSALYTFDYVERSIQEQRQYQFALHSSLPDMLMRERNRMLARTRERMARNISQALTALSSSTAATKADQSRGARTQLLISQRKLALLPVQVCHCAPCALPVMHAYLATSSHASKRHLHGTSICLCACAAERCAERDCKSLYA